MFPLCCQADSDSDVCNCMHLSIWAACLCASRTITGLAGLYLEGRRSSWTDGVTSSAQNHSPGSATEGETQTEVSELKGVSGSRRNIQTKTPEKEWTPAWPLELQTSRLWLTDRLWVEDGDAVTAPHQANWLAQTGSVFPTPWGLSEELAAILVSEPCSGLAQREN